MDTEFNLIKLEGKPVEKLIELLSKVFGTLYRPTAIRKEADAEAYRIERIAEANSKATVITNTSDSELLSRATSRFITQEVERQLNIEAIAAKAIQYLPDVVSSEQVDDSWRSRFFRHAQEVSDYELQEVWAKLLAEEIVSPGRTSVRSLDALVNLSKAEALLFKKISRFALNDGAIFYGIGESEFFEDSISFDEVMILIDAGLIRPAPFVSDYMKNNYGEMAYGHTLLKIKRTANRTYIQTEFDVYAFNATGRELMNTLAIAKSEEYLEKLTGLLRERGLEVEVALN